MGQRKRSFKLPLQTRKGLYGYLFIFPLIIGVACFFFPFMIRTIIFSFNKIEVQESGYTLLFQGIQYYRDAFVSNPKFLPLLVESLTGLASDIPVIIIFSLLISTLLNQKFKGRIIARICFFIPVLLTAGIVGQVENSTNLVGMVETGRMTSDSLGGGQLSYITNLVSSFQFGQGLIQLVVSVAEQSYRILQRSGIQIFVFLAGLQDISPSIYEAAKVEGCDPWQLFWKITVPMISPQILVNTIYTIVDTFTNADVEIFNYLNDIAFNQNQYGYSTAMSLVYLVAVGLVLGLAGTIITRFVHYNQ